ncbi:hypothetical protein FISHEDRAFT_75510 [Fistulina hepatica ATCC 64428]|uniref:Uncharacterized protein n=1 Tax=Fistulina hepatica ATCC 64428 TaxID=1128425 RepID=A0A0D7A9H0_9AGAR|nr:hypothetical protein FISHEDRAFT_75510 [Fistulina hepatica ATCC 64428]
MSHDTLCTFQDASRMPVLSPFLVNSTCMGAHTDVQSQDSEWNSTVSFDDSSLPENEYIPDGLLWLPTVSPDVGAGTPDDTPLEIIPLKAPSCPPIERSPSLPDLIAPDPSPMSCANVEPDMSSETVAAAVQSVVSSVLAVAHTTNAACAVMPRRLLMRASSFPVFAPVRPEMACRKSASSVQHVRFAAMAESV